MKIFLGFILVNTSLFWCFSSSILKISIPNHIWEKKRCVLNTVLVFAPTVCHWSLLSRSVFAAEIPAIPAPIITILGSSRSIVVFLFFLNARPDVSQDWITCVIYYNSKVTFVSRFKILALIQECTTRFKERLRRNQIKWTKMRTAAVLTMKRGNDGPLVQSLTVNKKVKRLGSLLISKVIVTSNENCNHKQKSDHRTRNGI